MFSFCAYLQVSKILLLLLRLTYVYVSLTRNLQCLVRSPKLHVPYLTNLTTRGGGAQTDWWVCYGCTSVRDLTCTRTRTHGCVTDLELCTLMKVSLYIVLSTSTGMARLEIS